MSIQWMDDFKGYNGLVAHMLDGTPWLSYGNSSIVNDPDPSVSLANKKVLLFKSSNGTSNYAATCRAALTTPTTKVGFAARFWIDFSGTLPSIHWLSTTNTMRYALFVSANGSLQFYRSTNGFVSGLVLLADTVAPVVFGNSWNHIEGWIDTATGNYAFYKEGIPIAALTGTDGAPLAGNHGFIGLANGAPGSGSGNAHYCKDFVMMDGLGTTNNNKIGPVILYRQHPVADISGGWTPSTGASNAATFDEDTCDDTDYASSPWPAAVAEVVSLEDLPADVVSVRGIMMLGRMAKSDGGDGQVQMGVKSGGSTGLGTDRAISTAYTFYWDVKEFDPATGVAWTPAGFNAAQLQLNRTV